MNKKIRTDAVDHLLMQYFASRIKRSVIVFLKTYVLLMNSYLFHRDLKLRLC